MRAWMVTGPSVKFCGEKLSEPSSAVPSGWPPPFVSNWTYVPARVPDPLTWRCSSPSL